MADSEVVLNSVFIVTDDYENNPRAWAEMAVQQILQVGETLPEPLRSQAVQFQQGMTDIIANYISIAVEADRIVRGK